MTEKEFIALVGPRLIHVTVAQNRAGIAEFGLMPAAEMALANGCNPRAVILRRDPVDLSCGTWQVRLNHQRPLRAGRGSAAQWLDNMSIEAWAAQLDSRVFFWPSRANAAFKASLEDRGRPVTLSLCAGALYRRFFDRLDLSPINSGGARRRPARRGAWLYVPVAATREAFRTNRQVRGLKRTCDSVTEISLRGAISPEALAALDPVWS